MLRRPVFRNIAARITSSFGGCRSASAHSIRLGLTLAALLVTIGSPATAQTCTLSGYDCVTRGNAVIGGIAVTNVCLTAVRKESCVGDQTQGTCSALAAAVRPGVTFAQKVNGTCELVAEECMTMSGMTCTTSRKTYRCWNGPLDAAPATLKTRAWRNLSEGIITECGPNYSAECRLVSTEVTEGSATRVINGRNFSRSWWARDTSFDCSDPNWSNTCGAVEQAPNCSLSPDTLCLAVNPDGSCAYEERTYNCDAAASFEASCQAETVCVGETCTLAESEASQDYPKAAAWLNFLDTLADDAGCIGTDVPPEGSPIDPASCQDGTLAADVADPGIFAGQFLDCESGLADCCKNPGNPLCSAEDRSLKASIDAGAAHHLGNHCKIRVLGICIVVVRSYCVYDGKFGRVFQEQANLQTGAQFAKGTPMPCPPLKLSQLETLDIEAMDLSEVTGDMVNAAQIPVEDYVIEQLSTQMGVFSTNAGEVFE